MTTSFKAHVLDTRVVFQIYAVLALAAGFLIAGWPPRSDLTPDPWANLVLMRITGAVIMAVGCCGAVAAGRTYIDPSVAARGFDAFAPRDDLTARETDVLRQLVLGRSNREIAVALCISEETVKTHIGNVLAKLQAENRAQAIVQALKRGLVRLEEIDESPPTDRRASSGPLRSLHTGTPGR